MQQQPNGYTNSSKTLSAKDGLGYWVYGQYYFMPEFGIVARYDNYDPNTGSDHGKKEIRAIMPWAGSCSKQIRMFLFHQTLCMKPTKHRLAELQ